jgi:hypothetical protein
MTKNLQAKEICRGLTVSDVGGSEQKGSFRYE